MDDPPATLGTLLRTTIMGSSGSKGDDTTSRSGSCNNNNNPMTMMIDKPAAAAAAAAAAPEKKKKKSWEREEDPNNSDNNNRSDYSSSAKGGGAAAATAAATAAAATAAAATAAEYHRHLHKRRKVATKQPVPSSQRAAAVQENILPAAAAAPDSSVGALVGAAAAGMAADDTDTSNDGSGTTTTNTTAPTTDFSSGGGSGSGSGSPRGVDAAGETGGILPGENGTHDEPTPDTATGEEEEDTTTTTTTTSSNNDHDPDESLPAAAGAEDEEKKEEEEDADEEHEEIDEEPGKNGAASGAADQENRATADPPEGEAASASATGEAKPPPASYPRSPSGTESDGGAPLSDGARKDAAAAAAAAAADSDDDGAEDDEDDEDHEEHDYTTTTAATDRGQVFLSSSNGGNNKKKGSENKKKAARKKAPVANGNSNSNTILPLGTRVYCQWLENDSWYWGNVRKVSRVGKSVAYDVEFPDGDRRNKVPHDKVVSEQDFYLRKAAPSSDSPSSAARDGACGCELCLRPPCENCHLCLTDDSCFQKMCCEISDDDEKAVAAPTFPEGWRFIFQGYEQTKSRFRHDPAFKQNRGLILLAPVGNRRYPSVERAISHNTTHLSSVNAVDFKRYVGLLGPAVGGDGNPKREQPASLKQCDDADDDDDDDDVPFDVGADAGSIPANFLSGATAAAAAAPEKKKKKKACGTCDLCRRPSCGRCDACRSHNVTGCFQKMCQKWDEAEKAVACPSFPHGWRFVFLSPEDPKQHHQENTDFMCKFRENKGLILMAPNGLRRYPSVEGAIDHNRRVLRGVDAVAFKQYVGLLDGNAVRKQSYADYLKQVGRASLTPTSRVKTIIPDHPLLQSNFLWEWIDANRRPQAVYGTVSECRIEQENSEMQFTVTYEENSRQLASEALLEFENLVPPSIDLHESQTWGCCCLASRSARKLNPTSKLLDPGTNFCFNWIVPKMVHDAMVQLDDYPGVWLPKRTVLVRGFELVFQAKESGIPDSGLGVWVHVKPHSQAAKQAKVFELKAGDMIDFGVYSPMEKEDRKPEHLNLAKNFVHNWEPEVYNYDVARHELQDNKLHVFDITDDVTGYLHDKARTSVLPYVNETSGIEIASVGAEYDPSGAVHYLLGHKDSADGPFRLPTDGTEVEIKVDYGPTYERVRVRKKYPRVGEEEQERLRQELLSEDMDTIDDLHRNWTSIEVAEVCDFLINTCAVPNVFPEVKRNRIFLMLLLLRSRALTIIDSFKQDSEDDSAETTNMNYSRAVDAGRKAKKAIGELSSVWWATADAFSEAMRSEDILKEGLMEVLNCTANCFHATSPRRLFDLVLEV